MSTLTALRPRHVAWLPAALLIAYLIAAATGMTTPTESRAASTGTTVEAEVLTELHMGVTSCAAPGGSVVENGDGNSGNNWTWARTLNANDLTVAMGDTELGNCTVTFGTNNDTAGAELVIENARGAGNAFCTNAVGSTCAGATGTFTNPGAAVATLDDGQFGFTVGSKSNCSGGLDTTNRHPLTNVAQLVCETSAATTGAGDGSVTVAYRANPSSSQQAGDYAARSILTVQPQ